MYDSLFDLLVAFGARNKFCIKPIDQWIEISPEFDIGALNAAAENLNPDQKAEIVNKDRKYFIYSSNTELEIFLSEVLDGYLHLSLTYNSFNCSKCEDSGEVPICNSRNDTSVKVAPCDCKGKF